MAEIQFLPPLHLACTEDEFNRNHSLIEILFGIASATNGHILVRIDLKNDTTCQLTQEDISNMEGKCIHMKTWAEIYKGDKLEFHDTHIEFEAKGIKKTYYYSTPQGQFFNIGSVVEGVISAGPEDKALVTYNPKLIGIIAKIFQHDSLNFSFSKGGQGAIVFPYEGSGMFAVLMPMDSNGVGRYYFR